MKRHRLECKCGKWLIACGSFLRSIVYWCRNCSTQKNVEV